MQSEEVPESQKYANEKVTKDHEITIKLISQTSLDQSITASLSENQKIEVVLALKSIHLEWLNIKRIQNLQVFSNLNILYLQHNRISKIENLQTLTNLEYLALNDNFITRVQNLSFLKMLLGLNLNNNQIEDVDYSNLPQNLQLLSFINNPVSLHSQYQTKILSRCKHLELLDQRNITPQDKFKALGIFPKHLIDYANKIKQFKSKRQIQEKMSEDEEFSKQVRMMGEVNEKQAMGEMRATTRKYVHEAQESFKQQINEQNQNFQSKIRVSKAIRDINSKQEKKRQQKLYEINQQPEHQEDN